MHFWQTIQKPIMAVAPMADVTDAPFRRMIAKYSSISPRPAAANFVSSEIPSAEASASDKSPRPPSQNQPLQDVAHNHFVTWTEFVAADGLMRAMPEGREKLLADLIYVEEERPIVAQLFSSNPEYMEAGAALAAELGFDGVDLNMGCPASAIMKQGCGSAMIKDPARACEVIRAAKRGAGDIPVSVKTRIGYNEDEIETWIPALLAEEPAVLTIHARTKKDMSKVPAKWDRVARAVEIRDAMGSQTLILGNGDATSLADGQAKVAQSGADGVMFGRALFGNPWFFHPTRRLPHRLIALPTSGVDRGELVVADTSEAGVEYIDLAERLTVLVEHSKLFAELLPFKSFNIMKKHYKGYINGFPGASTLRNELMQAPDPDAVERIVHEFLNTQS